MTHHNGQSHERGPDGLIHFQPVHESKEDVVSFDLNARARHKHTMSRVNCSVVYREGKADYKPYADLMNIDISTWDDGDQARQSLSKQLYEAMTTQGFFVLTGHCLSEREIERQVDIGYVSPLYV